MINKTALHGKNVKVTLSAHQNFPTYGHSSDTFLLQLPTPHHSYPHLSPKPWVIDFHLHVPQCRSKCSI